MYTLFKRRDRLALLFLGIMLIAAAAGIAAATAKTVQGSVDADLARHWRTDYDLLVRHPESVNELEISSGSLCSRYANSRRSPLPGERGKPLGGISLQDLKLIRSIKGVEVAAPMAMVGPITLDYATLPLDYGELEPGIYREDITVPMDNGVAEVATTYTRYILVNDEYYGKDDYSRHDNHSAGLSIPPFQTEFSLIPFPISIIAVDFEAEAALYGLDKALLKGSLPNYLGHFSQDEDVVLPMVLNSAFFSPVTVGVKTYRLTDLVPDEETVALLGETKVNLVERSHRRLIYDRDYQLESNDIVLPKLGERLGYSIYVAPEGLEYSQVGGELALVANGVGSSYSVSDYTYDRTGVDSSSSENYWFRKPVAQNFNGFYGGRSNFFLTYNGLFDIGKLEITSPDSPVAAPMEAYRSPLEPALVRRDGTKAATGTVTKSIHPYDFVGSPVGGLVPIEAVGALDLISIDSIRIRVSGVDDMSEASQVRIACIAQEIRDLTGYHVDIVLGSAQQRKPVTLYSYDNEARRDYIKGAELALAGAKADIEREIGMPVTVRMLTDDDFLNYDLIWWFYLRQGREPWVFYPPSVVDWELPEGGDKEAWEQKLLGFVEPALAELGYETCNFLATRFHRDIVILIPQYEMGEDEPRDFYGKIEQRWIKLGSQMHIYEETNRGTYWITLALLVVGSLFAGNATYITELGRRREHSILNSLGWRRRTIFRVSLTEAIVLSVLAGGIAAGVLAAIWQFSGKYLDTLFMLVVPPMIFGVFLLGSLLPLLGSIFTRPLEGLRQGELAARVSVGGASPGGFALRGLLSRPWRTLVSVLAMAIPAGVLSFVVFIFFGVRRVLGETLLGEYLALEFRSYHFALIALVFIIAGLAITDTLLVNVRERRRELALLKALGWRTRDIGGLLIREGMGMGLLSGIAGTTVALVIYNYLYGVTPSYPGLLGLLLVLIPVIMGALASILPAIRGARVPAATAIRED